MVHLKKSLSEQRSYILLIYYILLGEKNKMKRTLAECKKWLDEYIGLESEIRDYDAMATENIKTLIYRRKDKPILFKLIILDYGNGWELGAAEHKFQLEKVSKMMREY